MKLNDDHNIRKKPIVRGFKGGNSLSCDFESTGVNLMNDSVIIDSSSRVINIIITHYLSYRLAKSIILNNKIIYSSI